MTEAKTSRTQAAPRRAAKPAARPRNGATPDGVDMHAQVAEAAYYLAEKRGFEPGFEWEDWFRAEAELAVLPAPDAPKPAAKRAPRRGVKKAETAAAA